jgi:hypothetical protein
VADKLTQQQHAGCGGLLTVVASRLGNMAVVCCDCRAMWKVEVSSPSGESYVKITQEWEDACQTPESQPAPTAAVRSGSSTTAPGRRRGTARSR